MSAPVPTPDRLLAQLAAADARARAGGALHPIATVQRVIAERGMDFVVRKLSSLSARQAQQLLAAKAGSGARNPFLPYDPDMFVAEVSASHVALLNKFPVLPRHLLIVTRRYLPQEALLDAEDFAALAFCMAGMDGLAFYNAGSEAGASQPHKHLQIVPLPLFDDARALPIEALIAACPQDPQVRAVPGLPFRHAYVRLDSQAFADPGYAAVLLHAAYAGLIAETGIDPVERGELLLQSAPYNLIATRRWMMLVVRAQETCMGISVNALGFAGSLFVRDDAHFERLREIGPMNLLAAVSCP